MSTPELDDRALYGLVGDVVAVLLPHTEAAPVALAADLLISFGNAIGPGPHFHADGATHYARENVCIIGRTSRARKGTSRSQIRRVMQYADPGWSDSRVMGGLASGEGLIAAVRDPGAEDEGVGDRRLLVHEPEFSRVLGVAAREGSTVSPIIRQAFDDGTLRVMTRKDPLTATGAHISMILHTTAEELTRRLSDLEVANGFANRILPFLVDRSKLLPSGGDLDDDDYRALGAKVRARLEIARRHSRLGRTLEAEELWHFLYRVIDKQDEGGIVGALTARAEAHLLRLSMIYALTDGSKLIDVAHLEAAWAMLCYADDTARAVFGSELGDPIADKLLAALQAKNGAGLDGTEQRDLFSRHVSGKVLAETRDWLAERGVVENVVTKTDGRSKVVTFLRGDQSDLGDPVGAGMSLRSLRSQAERAHE